MDMESMMMRKSKKKKKERRFSDEQIKLMESMFESESRPEFQIKQQLANQIGLQPRQVAIWFQNKRARSKSKQIERDYTMLKISYDTLASRFDSLKKENQCLLIQLQRLRNLTGNLQESKNCELGQTAGVLKSNGEESESYNHEIGMPSLDEYHHRENVGEESDVVNMAELPADSSFTSSGNWCSFEFESSCLLDYSTCSSQWWDL
uniref:Homeobox-leucine zipper protein n=1 Tax=Davidia involucrata TaxID=16924 RepID=A0A5B7CCY4_DAVIN